MADIKSNIKIYGVYHNKHLQKLCTGIICQYLDFDHCNRYSNSRTSDTSCSWNCSYLIETGYFYYIILPFWTKSKVCKNCKLLACILVLYSLHLSENDNEILTFALWDAMERKKWRIGQL